MVDILAEIKQAKARFGDVPPPLKVKFLEPQKIYCRKFGFKRHRNKKRRQRFIGFSHYENIIPKGEAILDNIRNVAYVNASDRQALNRLFAGNTLVNQL